MRSVRTAGVRSRLLATSVSSTSVVTVNSRLVSGDSGTDGEEETEGAQRPDCARDRAISMHVCMLGTRLSSNGTEEELPMRKGSGGVNADELQKGA